MEGEKCGVFDPVSVGYTIYACIINFLYGLDVVMKPHVTQTLRLTPCLWIHIQYTYIAGHL